MDENSQLVVGLEAVTDHTATAHPYRRKVKIMKCLAQNTATVTVVATVCVHVPRVESVVVEEWLHFYPRVLAAYTTPANTNTPHSPPPPQSSGKTTPASQYLLTKAINEETQHQH